MEPQRPKMCKYGDLCRKRQNGTCNLYHPRCQPQRGRKLPPHNLYSKINGGNHQNTYPQNKNQKITPNVHYRNRGSNKVNQHQNQINQGPNNFLSEFCRYFHTGECKKQVCKRLHAFTKENTLRRVVFYRIQPENAIENMGTFFFEGVNYLSIRKGNIISFYSYDHENNQMLELKEQQWALPETTRNYHYYESHKKYIYFAFENPQNHFTDMGFYNITEKQLKIVQFAHEKNVSGMVHLTQGIVVSSSFDGTIKVWNIQNEKFLLDQEATNYLQQCYQPTKNIPILFLNFRTLGSIPLLTAGTADGRLLLWRGDSREFRQMEFGQIYRKVLMIRYLYYNQSWIGFVLLWNEENSVCAVKAINFATLSIHPVVEEQVSEKKQLMNNLGVVGNLLLISTIQGNAYVYRMPNLEKKIGVIMHQNTVLNMMSMESTTKTDITVSYLIVLEKTDGKREGSFSIFTLKQ